jgi:hypothetical protein
MLEQTFKTAAGVSVAIDHAASACPSQESNHDAEAREIEAMPLRNDGIPKLIPAWGYHTILENGDATSSF